MKMPSPDPEALARRPELINELRRFLPPEHIIADQASLRAYECDGLTAYKQRPMLVALPDTTQQVSQILRVCRDLGVKIVPRGAGTSLSGGALPVADGLMIGLAKFNQILEIDYHNRCAVVQSGVTNLAISEAVRSHGFYYAPDPSSQIACTIGGNVAENSGGVHCLKYGLTTHNILGLECVVPDGRVIRLGGKALDSAGYDLIGVLTGSEGLLAVITEVTVKILPRPETARAMLIGFSSSEAAGNCVADIISAGIIPAGMEMMDRPAINAAEDFVAAGYPREAEALLIVELDGPKIEVDFLISRVEELAAEAGADTVRISNSDEEREMFWKGRKSAFPAVGRISPDYYCMDGTIPRKALPRVLSAIMVMSKKYGLNVANVFHAGDGNLHPLILFDANVPGQLEKAEDFGSEILKLCVEVGGVLTGEHGVGVEKRDLMGVMFSDDDLQQQQRIKCAFDPLQLLNPGKVFPVLHRCAELGRMHIHDGRVSFPELPRF